MKKYYSKLSFLLFTILMFTFFTGCDDGGGPGINLSDVQGDLNAYDEGDSASKQITTKVAGDAFNLDIVVDSTSGGSGVVSSGSTAYYVQDVPSASVLGSIDYGASNVVAYDSTGSVTATRTISANQVNRNSNIVFYSFVNNFFCQQSLLDKILGFLSEVFDGIMANLITSIFGANSCYGTWQITTTACDPTSTDLATGGCGATACTDGNITNCYIQSTSTDVFAIRPFNLDVSNTVASNIDSVTSSRSLALNIEAKDSLDNNTVDYITTDNISVEVSNYYTDATSLAAPGVMAGTSAIITNPTFNNGQSTDGEVNFDNVGKVTMHFEDTNWAAVDIGIDATPLDCSANGAYVCGDLNATFIPASFDISNFTLKNANNGPFTYISGDINSDMVFALDFTLKAFNEDGNVVSNFDKDSWAKNMDITLALSTANTPTIIKKEIDNTTDLGFEDGTKTLTWNESNTNKQLRFTFERNNSIPLNPFKIALGDLNVTATATYPTGDVTGTASPTNTVNALYARSHAPRQRFNTSSGTSLIYFETFCYGTDAKGNTCDKSLLPNANASKFTDDPRWYVNSLHNASAGVVGSIAQVGTSKTTLGTISASTGLTSVPVSYTGNIYPYKATLENNASSWLIYDAYAAGSATKNKFEIEFENSAASWAGSGENSGSTASNGATKTNRRSMW